MSLGGRGQEVHTAGQTGGGPLKTVSVLDAPFSADAITTARWSLRDGTRLEQRTSARYYRDARGRVRVELLTSGANAPATMSERHIRTILQLTPESRLVWTMDAETRTIRYLPRFVAAQAAGGEAVFAVPVGGVKFATMHLAEGLLNSELPLGLVNATRYVERRESLGVRTMAGVEVSGRRVTMRIPAHEWRNQQPIELVDERWESPALQVMISGAFFDSRVGTLEYDLANVRTEEPPAELFAVPDDYTVDVNVRRTGGWWCTKSALFYTPASMRCGQIPPH